jgi:hypothetical protein
MIVNGASYRSVSYWSKHLTSEKNDRAELKEIRGLGAENLRDGLLEMQQDAKHTRLKNFFYQANFNPTHDEALTEEQWQRAFEIFEKHRGIPEGTARIVYEHEKEGRTHRHVVWSRVNMETGRAWSDALDAKVCHEASREISEELGLHRSISPFDKDRDGPRPGRAPKPWEMFRGLQSELDPREIKVEVTKIFRESKDALEFVEGLSQHGYQLAQGDRRDYVILDSAGEVHSLARRLDGVKAKELREFMGELPREMFPTVDQAKAHHRERNMEDRLADLATVQREIAWEEELRRDAIKKERKEERFKEPTSEEARELEDAKKRWPIQPPRDERTETSPEYHFADAGREVTRDQTYEPPKELRGMSAILMKAYANSKEGYQDIGSEAYKELSTFQESLDRMGMGFARVTREEAERSQRQASFAQAVGNYTPRFLEGEIVAVRAWHTVYRSEGEIIPPGQRVYKIDQGVATKFVDELGIDRSMAGVDATKKVLQAKVQEQAIQNAEKWRDIRAESTTKGRGGAREMGDAGGALAGAKITGRIATKAFDTVADLFEAIFAAPTPEQAAQAEATRVQREAEQAAQAQREQQERQSERQLGRDR